MASGPNMLFISLDTLRADHLSAYGYHRDTSPFLRQLARRGTLFPYAFVNTHGTPPSHATMLSGLYQEAHRVSFSSHGTDQWQHHVVPPAAVMVQEMLRRAGYTTVGVTDGGFMDADFGFARGFEHWDDGARGIAAGSERLLRILERKQRRDAKLAAEQRRPVFAFLHTYEVHSPYAPPDSYRELFGSYDSDFEPTSENLKAKQYSANELSAEDLDKVRALYDAGIRYADDQLRILFDRLKEIGFLDRCLVVITSDHGEEFGEHGGMLHRDQLFEELIHVPLILYGEGVTRGIRDGRLASSVDLAPTMLHAAGLRAPARLMGQVLLQPRTPGPELIFTQFADRHYAVRSRGWKLIYTPLTERLQLYDLAADLAEQNDVASEHPKRVAWMRGRLEKWQKAQPELETSTELVLPIANEDEERLRSLGYL